MGLIAFIKEAGEKLFGKEVKAAEATGDRAAADAAAGDAILAYIQAQKLTATGLTVTFDGASGIAKVYGVADDQATREKIILAAGNVNGVAGVEDNMTVSRSGPPAQYYTVVRGDTLSKIAKQFLWRRQQVSSNLRSQRADADASGQDLSGPESAHPAALTAVLPNWARSNAAVCPGNCRPPIIAPLCVYPRTNPMRVLPDGEVCRGNGHLAA